MMRFQYPAGWDVGVLQLGGVWDVSVFWLYSAGQRGYGRTCFARVVLPLAACAIASWVRYLVIQ